MLQSVLFIARILISMQCNLVCIQTAQKPPTLTWLVYISVNTFKITTLENYTFVVHCAELTLVLKQQKKRVFASWVKNTESIFELKQNKKRGEGSLKEFK